MLPATGAQKAAHQVQPGRGSRINSGEEGGSHENKCRTCLQSNLRQTLKAYKHLRLALSDSVVADWYCVLALLSESSWLVAKCSPRLILSTVQDRAQSLEGVQPVSATVHDLW